jgi:hypothetical protein
MDLTGSTWYFMSLQLLFKKKYAHKNVAFTLNLYSRQSADNKPSNLKDFVTIFYHLFIFILQL